MFPVLVAALSGIPIESPSNAEVSANDDLRARLKPASADRPQIPLPRPGLEEASLDCLEGSYVVRCSSGDFEGPLTKVPPSLWESRPPLLQEYAR